MYIGKPIMLCVISTQFLSHQSLDLLKKKTKDLFQLTDLKLLKFPLTNLTTTPQNS